MGFFLNWRILQLGFRATDDALGNALGNASGSALGIRFCVALSRRHARIVAGVELAVVEGMLEGGDPEIPVITRRQDPWVLAVVDDQDRRGRHRR